LHRWRGGRGLVHGRGEARRGLALRERWIFQTTQEVAHVDVDGCTRACLVHDRTQGVERFQEHVDQRPVALALAVAELADAIFRQMGDAVHLLQTRERTRAFQRVKVAKYLAHELVIAALLLERQQAFTQAVESFHALVQKRRNHVVGEGGHPFGFQITGRSTLSRGVFRHELGRLGFRRGGLVTRELVREPEELALVHPCTGLVAVSERAQGFFQHVDGVLERVVGQVVRTSRRTCQCTHPVRAQERRVHRQGHERCFQLRTPVAAAELERLTRRHQPRRPEGQKKLVGLGPGAHAATLANQHLCFTSPGASSKIRLHSWVTAGARTELRG
jgi:hypothetical protein